MSETHDEKSRETPQVEMNKIDLLCCTVSKMTDKDFEEMEELIKDQREWNIPLLPKTTAWQHELAEFNARVLLKVRELKELIAEGDSIVQPVETPEFFS